MPEYLTKYMNIRTIAERMARGRAFKRSFKVGGVALPIFISPDAQLKYMKVGPNAFDADLILIAEKMLKEDSVIWDIGANVGVFTFAAAAIATRGTVVSIEADIWLAGLLRKTMRLDSYAAKDIRIVPVAISDNCGISGFNVAMRGRASNSLDSVDARISQGGVRETQYVPTLTLDTLCAMMPKPDFVKIDVEGAESLVIKGANNIIDSVRPVFYMELGSESEEIIERFKDARYFCKEVEGGEVCSNRLNNVFFVPIEQNDMISRLGALSI